MLRQPGSSLRSRPAFGECLQVVGEQGGRGFFVELGASDGMSLRNSWLLDKWLGWKGILAEPASNWILMFPITYSDHDLRARTSIPDLRENVPMHPHAC